MTTPGAAPPPGGQPPPGAESLDPTVLDLLRGSALAPMLDMPVNDVLHSLGLPNLPELPAFGQLPELPPLPAIDLSALMRPLTDLASAFGTGQFGPPASAGDPAAAPAPAAGTDPTQMLAQVSTVMQTVMQVGTSALQTVMTLWQGMAAMEAAEKAGQAQQDAGKLAAQSSAEKQHLIQGATSVATGGALMTAVIAAFSAKMALAPLYATTAPGQVFLVASAVEAATEGLAITAKTKTELGVESAELMQTGEKVKITDAPTGVASTEQFNQLMQMMGMITPLIGTASQTARSLGQLAAGNTALTAPKPIDEAAEDGPAVEEGSAAGGLGAGGGGLGGAMGVAGAVPAPLSPFPGTKVAGPGPLGAVGAFGGPVGTPSGSAVGMSSAAATGPASSAAGGAPGYMPMGAGAAAGMARDGESVTDGSARGMVSAEHGDEVVGPLEGIAVPVIGAAETVSEPPPDKELTL